MQSIYSVYGSPIQLMLDDEFAQNYNNAQDAFFNAQKEYKETHGSAWTGLESLYIDWTSEQQKAFNDFAELMNLMIKLNGGSLNLKPEDMTSYYLEKL